MKSVLIFAKTPYARTPYDQWLGDSGIHPIVLVSAEHAEGYRHLPEVYSFANFDQNLKVQKVAYEIAKRKKPIAVFARAESDILRAAQLRELFGIPGQHLLSATAYRNKVVMKDHLRYSGVDLPIYVALTSAYQVLQFQEQHGFPFVIKPFAESGSTGTWIIRTPADLEEFLQQGSLLNMEIETFTPGQMYHVDGLRRQGKVTYIQASRYVNDCMSYRNDLYNGSVKLSAGNALAARLEQATNQIIAALPSPENMSFHCELWERPDGVITFCEIASRTGGGMINAISEKTSGINLDKEWFLAECGQPASHGKIVSQPGGDVLIPAKRGLLKKFPANFKHEGIVDFEFNGKLGQAYHGGIKSGLFLGAFVLSGQDENKVEGLIHSTAKWFDQQIEWEKIND